MPRLTKILFRRDTAANWSSTNPTLDSGEAGFDTTNKVLKMGDGVTAWNSLAPIGQQQILSNSFTDVTVTNTTTETSLASYSISGAVANDLYRLQAWGTLTNNTGSTVSTSILVKLGSTVFFSTSGTGVVTNATSRNWNIDVYIGVGTTSSQEAWGQYFIGSATTTAWASIQNTYVGRGTATEDLTSAKTLDLRWAFGTASTSAYVTMEGYYITRLRSV